ncbi:putative small heat shock protein HSP20 [Medicago truncatula]|uniref:22.0 kDa class IV heat shock protein n=1 Tax=Medicago truncatula TaxID=3880 RepID=A0A072VXN7_MEDTR|nr:22.7 kDa class IV heat shock protein [Medicago truncatula]KEH42835.1 22.0 kDa class IV heat shock protein [Medicago truncatula]RHN80443.1 putative small heat shock protein HSP20 [Medicago truncatula]
MRLQQLNMLLVPFFLLVLTGGFPTKAKGLLPPSMDSPNPLLADHFPDRFCVTEQIPYGVEIDQSAMTSIVDWKETSDEHVIMIDVPGFRKDEIKIEVVGNSVLSVIGERKKEVEKKGDRWHRAERMYGKFWRQLRLPENADFDSVKAKVENGVLILTLNKLSHEYQIKSIRVVSIDKENEKSGKLNNDGANTTEL